MTCEELRSFFAGHACEHASFPSDRADVAEHLAVCRDCSRFVIEQQELENGLRLLRGSVGSPSPSVDAAVLADYRGFSAESEEAHRATVRQLRPASLLRWSAAIAAMLVVGILFFPARRTVPTVVPRAKEAVAPPRRATLPAANAVAVQRTHSTKTGSIAARRTLPPRSLATSQISSVRVNSPMPDVFRSLMYCDALSCVGAMDVIRVQLPWAVVAGSAPGLTQASGTVYADVLVGPDGIARGIRIEE